MTPSFPETPPLPRRAGGVDTDGLGRWSEPLVGRPARAASWPLGRGSGAPSRQPTPAGAADAQLVLGHTRGGGGYRSQLPWAAAWGCVTSRPAAGPSGPALAGPARVPQPQPQAGSTGPQAGTWQVCLFQGARRGLCRCPDPSGQLPGAGLRGGGQGGGGAGSPLHQPGPRQRLPMPAARRARESEGLREAVTVGARSGRWRREGRPGPCWQPRLRAPAAR